MRLIVVLSICICLLTACTQPVSPTQLVVIPSQSITETILMPADSQTPSITVSTTNVIQGPRQKSITSTPAPTRTFAPPTPTFDAASVVTRTPQRPAYCPIQKTWLKPDFSWSLKYDRFYSLKEAVLSFLNSGGSYDKLIEPVTLFSYVWDREITFIAEATQEDLTGDGVPEIIMRDEVDFYILGCQAGEYQALLTIKGSGGGPIGTGAARLLDTEDINKDGIQEILISEASCGNCVGDDYQLLEWNGSTFSSLFEHQKYRSPYGVIYEDSHESGIISISGLPNDDPSIHPPILQDVDQNGIIELVLSGGIPSSFDARYSGPWRVETITLSWNGSNYIVTNWEADVPKFRFQAVQDGDVYTRFGNFKQALESYQQAIISTTLDSWNSTRQEYERKYIYDPYYEGIIPPEPAPDPVESAMLAAYSRYRIMLLWVIQGQMADAQDAYITLQSEYPEGTDGFIFTDLARIFWNDYTISQDTEIACSLVIQQVNSNPEIYLEYLGKSMKNTHGAWSLTYTAEAVCPLEKH